VHGERIVSATVTDHIESAAAHPELFWKEENHQSLCDDCNKRKAIELEGGLGRGG
jgi:5-methylcytosine-specific restriction endonuclease McrA